MVADARLGVTRASMSHYKNYRFPAEIVSHAVWLDFGFCRSYRDGEALLFTRGVFATYEAIRRWCLKFEPPYANQLRRRRLRPGDKRHLNEVFVAINKQYHYLWRVLANLAVTSWVIAPCDSAGEDCQHVIGERTDLESSLL
jgi:putative transposase